jgi:hypothetical protein
MITLASYGTQTVSEPLSSVEVPVLLGAGPGPGRLGGAGVGDTGVGALEGVDGIVDDAGWQLEHEPP